jgi:hypothetical protein
MEREIRRNEWSKFCRRFSSDNRYRAATVRYGKNGRDELRLGPDSPLIGMAVGKRGRQIDSIQLIAGCGDGDSVALPLVSIRQPTKMLLQNDDGGRAQSLIVESGDGTGMTIRMDSDREPAQQRLLVEKVAYSLWQRRGSANGQDFDDWLEAEARVRAAEEAVTQ